MNLQFRNQLLGVRRPSVSVPLPNNTRVGRLLLPPTFAGHRPRWRPSDPRRKRSVTLLRPEGPPFRAGDEWTVPWPVALAGATRVGRTRFTLPIASYWGVPQSVVPWGNRCPPRGPGDHTIAKV